MSKAVGLCLQDLLGRIPEEADKDDLAEVRGDGVQELPGGRGLGIRQK